MASIMGTLSHFPLDCSPGGIQLPGCIEALPSGPYDKWLKTDNNRVSELEAKTIAASP